MNKKIFALILYMFILIIPIINYANGPSSNSDIEYEKFLHKHGETLLKDYRLPIGNDFSYWGTDENTFIYKDRDTGEFKRPYWTKGDLNEDSIIDRCFILFGRNTDAINLFCFISKTQDIFQIIKVDDADKNMGVQYFKILDKSPIKNQLLLFEFEGHGSAFHWSNEKASFDKLW